jgi:hypothetical protein
MSEDLRSTLARLTSELRTLNQRLQSESPNEAPPLGDFRDIVDTIRLTTWTAHELAKVRQGMPDAKAVLVLTASERARRFQQMAEAICTDIESGILKTEPIREDLIARLDALRERLVRGTRESAA